VSLAPSATNDRQCTACPGGQTTPTTNAPAGSCTVGPIDAFSGFGLCTRMSDGTVRCLDMSDAAVTTAPATNILQIASGFNATCALLADHTVTCWDGNSSLGQNGPIAGLSNVTQVATMGQHVCARLSDGTGRCWGYNNNGQLGDGTTTTRATPGPTPVSNIAEFALTTGSTCARLTDGTVRCWGASGGGVLGVAPGERTDPATPAISSVAELRAGGSHVCARLTNGEVYCWGENGSQAIGDGTTMNRFAPTKVLGVENANMLAVGRQHSCVRRNDGAVLCWGSNNRGQLGNNSTANSSAVVVPGITNPSSLGLGHYTTLAIGSGGATQYWGRLNGVNQLTPAPMSW